MAGPDTTDQHGDPIRKPKLYTGIVWFGDEANARRISLMAHDSKEAGELVQAEFGPDARYSIRNEEDARRIR